MCKLHSLYIKATNTSIGEYCRLDKMLPIETEDASAGADACMDDASDDSSTLYETDEFRMYCYKVLPCAKRNSHEWTTCPFAHPNEKARRRDPRIYKYLAIPCPDTKEGKTCPRGDDCPNCHSLFEYWLHPSRYRTQLCRNNDGNHCKRQICFFAHSIDELRVPDHSHLHIPEEMKQQAAAAAAAAAAAQDSSKSSEDGNPGEASEAFADGVSSKDQTTNHQSEKPTAASPPGKKERRGSRSSICSRSGKQSGSAAATGLATTTMGLLSGSLDASHVLPSPCGPMTPMMAALKNGNGMHAGSGPIFAPAGLAACYGTSSGAFPGSSAYASRTASLDSGYDAASLFSAPGTPALRRGSLDVAALRAPIDFSSSARGSLDLYLGDRGSGARGSLDLPPPGARCSLPAADIGMSSLFSSSMLTDPQVPDPCQSPRTAAMQHLKQQQLLQQQLEMAVGAAALKYDLHLKQRQQQAAWLAGRAAAATAGGSPTVSPDPASCMVDSCNSLSADEVYGTYSPASDNSCPLPAPSAAWLAQALPRALSGPAAFEGNLPGGQQFNAALRLGSLDPSQAAAAAAVAADMAAAAQVQMAELQRAASTGGARQPQYSFATPVSPSSAQQRAVEQMLLHQQQQQQAAFNLQDVAQLVESANRGELGDCGNQVLTGVIGLLMQQLQHQHLVA